MVSGDDERSSKRRFAPPTVEEQKTLRGVDFTSGGSASAALNKGPSAEARGVFRSNLLALEVKELLDEARATPLSAGTVKSKKVKAALFRLHGALRGMPSAKIMASSAKAVAPCLKLWSEDPEKTALAFEPPQKIDIVGSYMLGSMVKAEKCIDVALTIPKRCIHAKDYLNYRFANKRALYLEAVANFIATDKTIANDFKCVEISAPSRDVLRASIVCKFSKKSGAGGYSVRITACAPEGAFPHRRFAPGVNNVRRRDTIARRVRGEVDEGDERPQPATPHYNASVLAESAGPSSTKAHLEHLHAVSKQCPSFADACTLVKVWMRQRRMAGKEAPSDSFNSFHTCMLLSHLVAEKQISRQSSALQLFTRLVQYLAKHDMRASRGFHVAMRKPDNEQGKFFLIFVRFEMLSSSGRADAKNARACD